jgi:hypothetical protein
VFAIARACFGTPDALARRNNLETIMTRSQQAFVLGASLFAACATNDDPSTTTPGDDELAGENGQDGEKADENALQDTFDIYTAQKVGAFDCIGIGHCTHVDIIRAGRSTTTCADGSSQASCQVDSLDLSMLGLSDSHLTDVYAKLQASAATPEIGPQLLVRGKFVHHTDVSAAKLDWDDFQVSELWVAQMPNTAPDGTFVMLRTTGHFCVDSPCGYMNEARLNSTRNMNMDGLDWPAPYRSLITNPGWLPNRVITAESIADGVIVAGDRTHGEFMHLPTTLRSVNQVFLNASLPAAF